MTTEAFTVGAFYATWSWNSPSPLFRLFWCSIQNSWLQEKVKHLSCINKTPWGESCSMSIVIAAERNGICFLCSLHPNVVCSSCTQCRLFMYNTPEKTVSPHWAMVVNLENKKSSDQNDSSLFFIYFFLFFSYENWEHGVEHIIHFTGFSQCRWYLPPKPSSFVNFFVCF